MINMLAQVEVNVGNEIIKALRGIIGNKKILKELIENRKVKKEEM